MLLVSYIRIWYCPLQGHDDLLLSPFYIKICDPFWDKFYVCCDTEVHIYSFACGYPVSQHHVEKTILSPQPYQKSIDHKCEDLFLDSGFSSIGYIAILLPIPHYVVCFGFVINSRWGNMSPLTLFFLLTLFVHSESL